MPEGTIDITFTGSAGNSFGAFVPSGMTLRLHGDANDFVGKGLSGGRIVVRPPLDAAEGFVAEDNIIGGNVILFGATSGEALLRGVVGERFAVRNSGATAVVEGVGDHGCEYMTGGKVVILGATGRNFGAGMSGGVAYIYNPDKAFEKNLNTELVDLEDLSGDDFTWLKGAIERHRDETGSEVATRILADWSQQVGHFAKVMPRDYKKVLLAIAAAEKDGKNVDEAVMEQLVGDPSGFLKHTSRELPVRRPVPLRLLDWKEVYEEFPKDTLKTQASRCMDCGIPFCHNGCPLGNLIPEWNDLVYKDHWHDAIERLHATNNFPEFTGRLCPAPCEASCVLGINQDPVTIKQVEVEIIDKARRRVGQAGSRRARHQQEGCGCRQWSGRSGCSAAADPRRSRSDGLRAGRPHRRLLRYGIPEFKMEKRHIDRRLEQMEAEGTVFKTNVNVGVDITADELREQFDAVVLAGGATAARDLPIPGRELDGIHQAMEFLPIANRVQLGDLDAPTITAEGKKVVIIGGGDTGADCSHLAPSGCGQRPPVRDHAASAGDSRRADAVADVPAHVPRGFGSRGGRRASVLRQHRELRR